jgi:hypothetical protein
MFHTLNPEVLVDVINARVYSLKNTGPIISPTVNLSSIDNSLSSLVEQFVPQVNNSYHKWIIVSHLRVIL